MATPFHTIVGLDRIKNEDANRTFLISGTVTKADEGKAVSLDTTAPNTVKLAGDGDVVIGRLEVYESRGTCTVASQFSDRFPIKNGETVVVGNTVVGGGAGTVKAAGAANHNANYVVEVITGFCTVVKL